MTALLCAASCTDYLKPGVVDLTPKPLEYPSEYTFNHPCAYVTGADLDRTKSKIAAADAADPVYSSWLQFQNSSFAQKTYKASPVEILVRGDATGTGVSGENYIQAARDAAAAFQLALRYKLSGDTEYADAAVAVLNDWADVCKKNLGK